MLEVSGPSPRSPRDSKWRKRKTRLRIDEKDRRKNFR